jgi:tetratricopeptide (TPR) repeat protein
LGYWDSVVEHVKSLEYGRRCLERAAESDDLALKVTGLFYTGHVHQSIGRYAEGIRGLTELIALLEGPLETERFGHSGLPYSGACALCAEMLAEIGDHDGAIELIRRGERVANRANHLYSQMVLAAAHGYVLVRAHRVTGAIDVLEPTVATCRAKRFLGQLINALRHLGEAYVLAGRPADAVVVVQESIVLQEYAKVYVMRGTQLAALASAYTRLGDLDQAERTLAEAFDFARRLAEPPTEAWVNLVGGELAVTRGDRAAAERYLSEARAIAEALGMRPLASDADAALRARA